jgi:hypothetical protein
VTSPPGAAWYGVRAGEAELDAFLRDFRVITPLDHRDPGVTRRADVMAAWPRDLKQEAPRVYRDIGPVVSSLCNAGVADPVVRAAAPADRQGVTPCTGWLTRPAQG